MKIIKIQLRIEGMTCSSCELRIENTLKKLEGINEVKADYTKSKAYVTFDADKITVRDIKLAIEKAGC